jgi:hypothetical protein
LRASGGTDVSHPSKDIAGKSTAASAAGRPALAANLTLLLTRP